MQEYIALSLFRIDLPSVGQYGIGCGQYIPVLTSHSVTKSISDTTKTGKVKGQEDDLDSFLNGGFLNTGFCGIARDYNPNKHQVFNRRVLMIKNQPVVSYDRVLTVLKQETEISNIKKFLIYQIKKHFRLFLEIAPLYKKQNRLIFRNGFLISGFLL